MVESSARGYQTGQEIFVNSGAGKLFKSGLEFSTENAKETTLNEVHPENAKAIPEIVKQLRNHVSVGVCEGCWMKTANTTSIYWIRSPKHIWFMFFLLQEFVGEISVMINRDPDKNCVERGQYQWRPASVVFVWWELLWQLRAEIQHHTGGKHCTRKASAKNDQVRRGSTPLFKQLEPAPEERVWEIMIFVRHSPRLSGKI